VLFLSESNNSSPHFLYPVSKIYTNIYAYIFQDISYV
jgi:hypothetical protein